jgi:membrane peptidoglycan carboxypeptidase
MSMMNPNSDDREQPHSEQFTDNDTTNLEKEGKDEIQGQIERKATIILPSGTSPAASPTAVKPEKGSSSEQDQSEQASDKTLQSTTRDQGKTKKTSDDEQKTALLSELAPFTSDDAALLPTQSLTSEASREPVRSHESPRLQREHINLSNLPTRALVPLAPVGTSVRTPATLQALKAQRHKKLLLRHLSRKHMRQDRIDEKRESKRFWGSIMAIIAIVTTLFLSIATGGTYAAYSFYTTTQEQYNAKILDLHALMPGDNLKMYDRNNILIAQDTSEGVKTEVAYKDISPFLVKATIDIEDKGFWDNAGIDVTRIIQSALDDLRSDRVVAGGSTITQQLIKNLILGQSQTLQRKFAEISLIPDVNSHYTKTDILEMYLNSNNYGELAYGIDAAATVYFGLEDQGNKSAASQLDLAQAAMLAGIPNSPSAFDPLKHPRAAFTRFKLVLDAMVNNKDITVVQKLDAIKEAQKPDFFKTSASFFNRAPHFYFFILDQLKAQYHLTEKQIAMSDMKVYTTLDITLQDKIQKFAQEQIAELEAQNLNISNSAEVLIDFHTGAIISMLGSIDYYSTAIDGQYNVALAYRQPGSSMKPYVYVAAFSEGISPGQDVADEPLTIALPGENFTPQNADQKFHGQMTIRCALQNSLNIPAVRALQYVGIDAAMQTAKNMGITSYKGYAGYSLVLGGLEVRLVDHTSAYGTFANEGVHVPHYGIEKVVFASTGKVDQHKQDPGTRAISPQQAYMMTNVLSDNVARTPEFGRCSMLSLFSNSQSECYAGNPGVIRPSAAKSGTTNNFRDNWTMGYTTDYVMGVWSGNNDNSPMNTVVGVTGAAPIWRYGMLVAEENHPISNFANPGGIKIETVAYPGGVRSTDLYLQGQNPRQAASNSANQILSPKGSGNKGGTFCPSSSV